MLKESAAADRKKAAANITWFAGQVSREDRERLHGHPGLTVWFTGLSASGKSTIAHLVEKKLHDRGCSTYVLDGDNVRHGLNSNLGFSPEDRAENIRRIGETAKLFVEAGVIVLAAFISPYRADRDRVRGLLKPGEFIEVYTECSVEVCAARDWKGLYEKARAGLIPEFTGISAPYEPPDRPELVMATDQVSAVEAADRLVAFLETYAHVPTLAEKRRGIL